MSTATTRRRVLAGVAGGAVAATVAVTSAAANDDAALLRLIAEFHAAHAEARAAHDEWVSEAERVRELPDCPPLVAPAFDRIDHDRYCAFMKEHGVDALSDRSTELWRCGGALAQEIFTTPASTLKGAIAKLAIVRLALGDDDDTADRDLEAYQYDSDERWFANVMRDFERLSNGRAA